MLPAPPRACRRGIIRAPYDLGGVPEMLRDDERLWRKINADMEAMRTIISDHFRTAVLRYEPLSAGCYARVFRFFLEENVSVVARIVLPLRERLKTEAEVAAMEFVKARTKIPVPQVYLYCSTPHNPVKAEWIVMEFMPGVPLIELMKDFSYSQKLRTTTDMVNIMASMFQIKAPQCGSIHRVPKAAEIDGIGPFHRAQRFKLQELSDLPANTCATVDGHYSFGPLNDGFFVGNSIGPHLCGPFRTEHQFMQALALFREPPTQRRMRAKIFQKVLDVFDAAKQLHRWSASNSLDGCETFRFSHGDLNHGNILVDPETGAITGLIDWEMAGFRPAWLAADPWAWWNDDKQRFLMSYSCGRGGYKDETPSDALVRAHFRLQLAAADEELYRHYLQGTEFRAFLFAFYEPFESDVVDWLRRYKYFEWVVQRRGPFPFDYQAWVAKDDRFVPPQTRYVDSDGKDFFVQEYHPPPPPIICPISPPGDRIGRSSGPH